MVYFLKVIKVSSKFGRNHLKFACAVNIYASSTAINETFGPSFLRGSQIGGIFCYLHAFMIVFLVEI